MDIVFAQDPTSPDLRLVDIEDGNGHSINAGLWITRPDGYRVLRIADVPPAKTAAENTASTTRIHEMVRHYLTHVPGARNAYDTDAGYHFELKLLIRMLGLVEQAMRCEGVSEETRIRVARTVIYGAPDEPAADTRAKLAQLEMDRARTEVARPLMPGGWKQP